MRPLDVGGLRARRPATLLVYSLSNVDFDVFTGSPMAPIWVQFGVSEEAEGVRAVRVVDPTPQMAATLAQELAGAYVLEVVGSPAVPPGGRAPRGGADLLLELTTLHWGTSPVPWQYNFQLSPRLYFVQFEVVLKLTDLRDGAVLAQQTCVGDDPRMARAQKAASLKQAEALEAGAPTYPEMSADGGARLKAEIARAAARCYAKLRAKALRLPLTSP